MTCQSATTTVTSETHIGRHQSRGEGNWSRPSFLKVLLCGFLLVGVFCVSEPMVLAATIVDQDTTIDGSSPIFGSHIEVIDGPGGPTSVGIVSGGSVAGFYGRQNSMLTLDGGAVTFISGLEDNAKLIVKSGQISCSEPVCLVIDYNALLNLAGNSSLHVYGGDVQGPISLVGNSTAHFYGMGLSLSVLPAGGIVEGELASGEPAYFSVSTSEPSTRIFLHEVPEPGSFVIASMFITAAVIRRRFRIR